MEIERLKARAVSLGVSQKRIDDCDKKEYPIKCLKQLIEQMDYSKRMADIADEIEYKKKNVSEPSLGL